jgi:DNA helicase-2/ATP-dependent DNA helicase PcrA
MYKQRRIRIPTIQLNNDQAKVVDWKDGALIVTAGPGSGKTRVVVERIARMIQNGIRPESILATTFTKKAAEEMNQRLEAKRIDTMRMSVQTTHSFCFRLINEAKEFKGWEFDEKERGRIMLKIILGYKEMNWVGSDQTLVENFISTCRNNLLTPEQCIPLLQGEYADKRYGIAYEMYDAGMAEKKLYSFDDMLYHGVRILQFNQRTLDKIQARYQYVMVDEAQDSNFAQITLAHLVASPEFNLMVVGDEDQGIYKWRGALPEYMLDFQEKYNAERITLGINYRCAPTIVHAATKCIEHNTQRLPKNLVPSRETEMKIQFKLVENPDHEAATVGEEIVSINNDGVSYGNVIILMRTNAQSRAIEEEFTKRDIPFVVLGAVSFYERKEIKRLLAYIRLIVDPRDSEYGEIALRSPYRHTSAKLHGYLTSNTSKCGGYLNAIDDAIDNGQVGPHCLSRVVDFVDIIRRHKADDSPNKVLQTIVDETDFIHWLEEEEGSETLESDRTYNVNELVRSASRFETCTDLIKYVDKQIKLRKRNQRKKNESRVQVMSIHKSKGTESLAVFLIGANEGIIPHYKGDEEEERRLFYVAITRAKDILHITAMTNLVENGQAIRVVPSRFVIEAELLPEENLTPVEDSTTL